MKILGKCPIALSTIEYFSASFQQNEAEKPPRDPTFVFNLLIVEIKSFSVTGKASGS